MGYGAPPDCSCDEAHDAPYAPEGDYQGEQQPYGDQEYVYEQPAEEEYDFEANGENYDEYKQQFYGEGDDHGMGMSDKMLHEKVRT